MRWKASLIGGLLMVAISVAPASAVPIFGQLSFTGTATVSATQVDWEEFAATVEAGEGNFGLTTPSTGYFAGIDVPIPTRQGDIIDLTPANPPPLANFLHQFITGNARFDDLSFTLEGLTVPAVGVCTGAEAVGDSCVAFAGSPFLLTRTDVGTGVLFDVFGFFLDPTEPDGFPNDAVGRFSASVVGSTPNDIRLTILGGGNVTAPYGATFTAVPIPEPVSLTLLGTGLLGVALRARRKKR
jgi:hypothetical protein